MNTACHYAIVRFMLDLQAALDQFKLIAGDLGDEDAEAPGVMA